MSAEITDALSAFCSTRLSDVGGKNSSDWVLLSQKPSSRGKSDFNQIQRWTECSLLLREKMISHVPLPSENSKIYPLQPLPKPFSLLADDFFQPTLVLWESRHNQKRTFLYSGLGYEDRKCEEWGSTRHFQKQSKMGREVQGANQMRCAKPPGKKGPQRRMFWELVLLVTEGEKPS